MIVDEFSVSFESFVTRITDGTRTLSSPPIYKLEMQQLNGMLLTLKDTEIELATELSKCIIRKCNGKLFEFVILLDFIHDNLAWFLINLYINKFVRLVYPEIKLFWPILNTLRVYTTDIKVLHALIENSLVEKSTISWLTSRILLHIVEEVSVSDLVKEKINTKENVKKFRNILRLNHDITTELNLVQLFVSLHLESVFLIDMVVPYVSYIQSINSNFKRFIPCSTSSKDSLALNCTNCFMQPVDGYLLVLWFQLDKTKIDIFYINLMTLNSFRALPDGVIRLNFKCHDKRKLRSDPMLVYKYMSKFSFRNDATEIPSSTIEFKLSHHGHYNWLVGYLKRNVQHRKISLNSTLQVPLSQMEEVHVDCEKHLVPIVAIQKRKFSQYGYFDDDDDDDDNGDNSVVQNSVKRRKTSASLGRSSNSLLSSNIPDVSMQETTNGGNETSISSKNGICDKDEQFSEQNLSIDINTTISEVTRDDADPKNLPSDSTISEQQTSTTICINESLKLFTTSLVLKLQLLELSILERKNELQQQLDREFAKIESMQNEKLKEISKYVTDELNKFM